MALVPQIHMFEPERNPAEPSLGKEDLELRVALENPGEHQLGSADRRRQPEIAQPFEQTPAITEQALSEEQAEGGNSAVPFRPLPFRIRPGDLQ